MKDTTAKKSTDLLDYLNTAVVLLDELLQVRYLNTAAEMLFRVSIRHARGLAFVQLAPGNMDLEQSLHASLLTGRIYTERERRLVLLGEQSTVVDFTVSPLPGRQLLLEFIQLDRVLRISREHHLATQNRAIKELVAGLAHEVKNPLGGLRGAAQLLERELPDERLKEYTQVIISEADRLQTLVNSLLGSHRRPPERRSINIHEVVERVRQLIEAEAPPGVEIVRDYDPSIPPLTAVPDQLIQALLNIVRNALEVLTDGGTITLRTRTQRHFTLDNMLHKLVVRIDVIDNGPGIEEDVLDRIFYPMVTTRPEGTGLGLSIAQNFVGQHGGLIECTSQPGNTVFTIWLPLEGSTP